ncbi:MAG: HAMP domain-containing sensor histidine kinase, partial [Herbaspirillum sp.]
VDISTIRAAERSRDETLRFLSHDMRAPQASILALLELQSETTAVLPQAELFLRIEKAARKTLGLADNFVQLARAESHEYRYEEVSFQDLVLDAADEMWALAKNHQIRLITQLDDDDLLTKVDRVLFTRALVNLISNAINYSPPATQIVLSAHHSSGGNGKHELLCVISDQGYGIAAADQPKLFQRFQRLQTPGQARKDGIGLGLVFVKTVVERHGGQISFTSEVGLGTSFTIHLPLIESS